MKFSLITFVLFLHTTLNLQAQHDFITVNPEIKTLKDSVEQVQLIEALSSFLMSAQKNDGDNKWILESQYIETQMLIDEIQDIQVNTTLEDAEFYKPYLNNIVLLEEDLYKIQLSYLGKDESTIYTRANFEILAHKTDSQFFISSPLVWNTQLWKSKKINSNVFHFPYYIDSNKVEQYCSLSTLFDEKLKIATAPSHYYLLDHGIEALKLFGVNYKSDYSGEKMDNLWIATAKNQNLYILKQSAFYDYSMHDLWHDRLSEVISRRKVHNRVDCHIAYLYGGSWGFTWNELFDIFVKEYVKSNNVDWLAHKKNKSYFETDGRKNYTDDFCGALIIKKIEAEHGFEGVWKLLKTNRTTEDEEYYEVLNELTGISKSNYNKEIHKLIAAEIKSIYQTL